MPSRGPAMATLITINALHAHTHMAGGSSQLYSAISTASGYCPLYFLRAIELEVGDGGARLALPAFAVSLPVHASLPAMSARLSFQFALQYRMLSAPCFLHFICVCRQVLCCCAFFAVVLPLKFGCST
jgi:hypothetical protein